MERMDKIVLGGFGLVMLAGSAATIFIPNIIVRSLVIGGMYFGLIGIVVMTDWMSTLEAGKNPHLKIVIRDPETGIGYPRDFYIGKPFPIGDPERGIDPTGEYAYGVGLPLIKGVDFSFFLPNDDYKTSKYDLIHPFHYLDLRGVIRSMTNTKEMKLTNTPEATQFLRGVVPGIQTAR